MTYVLGERSLDRLSGVHPALAGCVKKAITLSAQDFSVIEGARTKARQIELYAKGRTTAELIAAGITGIEGKPDEKKVTWTLNSRHIPKEDGYSHAVDLVPYPIDWSNTPENLARFDAVALAMFRAAAIFGIRLRWGADWDGDGVLREKGESDSPHFELAAKMQ